MANWNVCRKKNISATLTIAIYILTVSAFFILLLIRTEKYQRTDTATEVSLLRSVLQLQ